MADGYIDLDRASNRASPSERLTTNKPERKAPSFMDRSSASTIQPKKLSTVTPKGSSKKKLPIEHDSRKATSEKSGKGPASSTGAKMVCPPRNVSGYVMVGKECVPESEIKTGGKLAKKIDGVGKFSDGTSYVPVPSQASIRPTASQAGPIVPIGKKAQKTEPRIKQRQPSDGIVIGVSIFVILIGMAMIGGGIYLFTHDFDEH